MHIYLVGGAASCCRESAADCVCLRSGGRRRGGRQQRGVNLDGGAERQRLPRAAAAWRLWHPTPVLAANGAPLAFRAEAVKSRPCARGRSPELPKQPLGSRQNLSDGCLPQLRLFVNLESLRQIHIAGAAGNGSSIASAGNPAAVSTPPKFGGACDKRERRVIKGTLQWRRCSNGKVATSGVWCFGKAASGSGGRMYRGVGNVTRIVT